MSEFISDFSETRLFRAQERILHLIAEGTGLNTVLEQLVLLVDELSAEGIASILLLGDDGVHVDHSAAPGLPDAYNQALLGVAIGPAVGACGSAMYNARQVITTDISSDPLWDNFKDLALAQQLHACWSTPLLGSGGQVLGSFAIYFRTVREPDQDDLHLISRITHLLSVAVEHFRNREAISDFREQLEERDRRLSTLVSNLPGMVYRGRKDENWTMEWVSEGCRELIGYSPEELLHNNMVSFASLMEAEDIQPVVEQVAAACQKREIFDVTYRIRHADGDIRWVWERGRQVGSDDDSVPVLEGVISDITAMKTQERALARANRSLLMLSRCNEALIRAQTEPDLLEAICKVVVDVGGYPVAWVAMPDGNDSGRFVPQAWAREPGCNLQSNNDLIFEYSDGAPEVLKPLFFDQASLHLFDPQQLFPSGIPACNCNFSEGFLLPLSLGDEVQAVFALLIREGELISEPERKLLGELASDLAFGIASRRIQVREERLQSAVLGIASAFEARSGPDFFDRLAANMAEVLDAKVSCVAKLVPGDTPSARVISGVVDGQAMEPLTYPLAGTPCETYLKKPVCIVRDSVCSLYPDDVMLEELGGEAYVGVSLEDAAGNGVGFMFVLFDKAITEPEFILSTLGMFAVGAAAELERMERESRIEEQAALLEQTRDSIILCDRAGRIEYWNRGAEQLFGWPADEVTGQSLIELLKVDVSDFNNALESLEKDGYWEGILMHATRDDSRILLDSHWTLSSAGGLGGDKILQVGSDVTHRKQDEARIHRLAFYDGTTGLPNRVLAMERLHQVVSDTGVIGTSTVLLIINLNRFKEINESLGHSVGDEVLMEVARRLRSLNGEEVFVARLGADEFFCLMPGFTREQGAAVASRIAEALSQPMELKRHRLTLSASSGMAVFPEDADAADRLLRHADMAMDNAKAQNRSWLAYEHSMAVQLNENLSLARDFLLALENGGLELYFQPQIELSSGRICGAEALLRWYDPERGWISPAYFIPVLEERRMMSELGPWLFREVASQISRWNKLGLSLSGPISINLAAEQLDNDAIVDQVASAISESGIKTSDVALELTETGIMKDPERSALITRQLKDAGFQLAIDDFGTGYSSMTYLKQFPADVLKIDIQFIRNMMEDPSDLAIVQTIISMAHALGMKTLAEGVETEAQAASLRTMGCEWAQGYLFGRPCDAGEFASFWL